MFFISCTVCEIDDKAHAAFNLDGTFDYEILAEKSSVEDDYPEEVEILQRLDDDNASRALPSI